MQFRGGKYDVIIIGTGPAGAKAALAAARTGCSTLLLTLNSGTVASVMCSGSAEEPTRGHSLREIDVIQDVPDENLQKLTIESQKFVDNPYSAVYILQAQENDQEFLQQQNYYNYLPHIDGEPLSSESLSSEEYLPASRKRQDAYRPQVIDSRSGRDPFHEQDPIDKREVHSQRSQSEISQPRPASPNNIRPFQTKAKASKTRLEPFQTQTPDSPPKKSSVGRTNPERRRTPFQTQKEEKSKLGPFQTKLPNTQDEPVSSQQTTVYERRMEPFQARPIEERNNPIQPFASPSVQSTEKRSRKMWTSEPEQTTPLGYKEAKKEHSILQERETEIRGKMLRRGSVSTSSTNFSEQTSSTENEDLNLILPEETQSVFQEREVEQRRRLIGGPRRGENPTHHFNLFERDPKREKKEPEVTIPPSFKERAPVSPFTQRKESAKRIVSSELAERKRVNPALTDPRDPQESIPPKKNTQRQAIVWEEEQSRRQKTTKKAPSKLRRQEEFIPPQEAARQILKHSVQTEQTDGLKRDRIDFEDPYGSNSWEDLSNPFEDEGKNDMQTKKRKLALRGLNSLINNLG